MARSCSLSDGGRNLCGLDSIGRLVGALSNLNRIYRGAIKYEEKLEHWRHRTKTKLCPMPPVPSQKRFSFGFWDRRDFGRDLVKSPTSVVIRKVENILRNHGDISNEWRSAFMNGNCKIPVLSCLDINAALGYGTVCCFSSVHSFFPLALGKESLSCLLTK